jgi:ATP-dependent Clp protease adaptor protein ClpS
MSDISTGMWNVIFYKDDKTPMGFIQAMLEQLYNKSKQDAFKISMEIHKNKKAIVGSYTKDIAISKAEMTEYTARGYEYPLKVKTEEI